MIIKAIILPTPKRIMKAIKSYCTKDRILIYFFIGSGILVISLTDTKLKGLSIGGLLYCGFTYEVIERTDPKILSMIYKNSNNIISRNY
ncbi:hypothetical protein ACFO6R_03690 [Eubacterium multiforme]|nr:hypothetical protein [Eubacterium multiforme]